METQLDEFVENKMLIAHRILKSFYRKIPFRDFNYLIELCKMEIE